MVNYNPKEFTLVNYEQLILCALNHFEFINYSLVPFEGKGLYWRHDVDFSLEQAVKLAEIEYKHGVQSTYFLLLHSHYYNLLDLNSLQLVKQILQFGHNIGLHFDANYYGKIDDSKELLEFLILEKNVLEAIFHITINAFSFHNPSKKLIATYNNLSYAGMINTYSNYFIENVAYCSDSNGYWRFRNLKEVLEDKSIKGLQVLTHPVWWTSEALSPREKIMKYIKFKMNDSIRQYDNTLKSHNRINIL